MKIFENGAKIYSIKKVLHSGYRIVIDMVVVIDESIVFVISVRLLVATSGKRVAVIVIIVVVAVVIGESVVFAATK